MSKAKRTMQIITGVLCILFAVFLSAEWYITGMLIAAPFFVCGILMCVYPEHKGIISNFTARTVVLLIFACIYLVGFILTSNTSGMFKFEIVFLIPILLCDIVCLCLKHH